MREKRCDIRLITSTLVQLTNDRRQWVGTITDISEGGMHCSRYGEQFEPLVLDDVFRCFFIMPTGKVECFARVASINEDSEAVGLSFADVDPVSREVISRYCDSPF